MICKEARIRDPGAITVTLTYLDADEVGLLELPDGYAPAKVDARLVTGTAPLAEDAISFAKAEAERIGCDVAVIDPDGLWTSSWGTLEPVPASGQHPSVEPAA